MFLKRIYHALAPNYRYLKSYRCALADLGDAFEEQNRLFHDLVANSAGKKCLQIGVMNGAKYAAHWVAVDLYDDSPLIDFKYDVHDLKFPDASFDVAVCDAVLEHVPYPQKAVDELHRVLRPGGYIWLRIPWVQPFHEMPKDYWRVSPEGLRVWAGAFNEIRCAHFSLNRSAINTGVFFYGQKPVGI